MKINKELLPMKGHFFFFNAGTAPLVPYLSTYAKQLGFSSYVVGIIYTVLPIIGLIAKPLFGALADRFRIQKKLFIAFQVVTALSFLGIYLVPRGAPRVHVQLDCGDGEAFIRSCGHAGAEIQDCSMFKVMSENETTRCEMTCDMSSREMWQTVCEHWHVPEYCYSHTSRISFAAAMRPRDPAPAAAPAPAGCERLYAHTVVLDQTRYHSPRCSSADKLHDSDERCSLDCKLPPLKIDDAGLSCLPDHTYFTVCNTTGLRVAPNESIICEATCEVEKAWRLMELCEGWGADEAASCQPGADLPPYISFSALVPLSKTLPLKDCVFFKLQQIMLSDGSVHYPNCPATTRNTSFNPQCTMSCENAQVNELLHEMATAPETLSEQMSSQFWLFFLLMACSWVGMAVVVSIADAICFDILDDKPSGYGRQRLWGSVGFGAFSLLTGVLVDHLSAGAVTKNYTVAFALMLVFLALDVLVSFAITCKSSAMSVSIVRDVSVLARSPRTLVFAAWTVCVGVCTGLVWNFLFWHLEEVSCTSAAYMKTLQGLVSVIQCYAGEIPFLYLSGPILKKLGHSLTMSLVLMAFALRLFLYAMLSNPWWVLPVELLQGVTFGMFYPTMTSYASVVAPPGTETTVQGLVGAIFEGVGTSLGSFVGGVLYYKYGGARTFLAFAAFAMVACVAHLIAQKVLAASAAPGASARDDDKEFSGIVRYAPPIDAIHMLEIESDDY